jgi:hypothetical protein
MFHCPYFLHVFTVSNGFINRVLIVATTPSKCFFFGHFICFGTWRNRENLGVALRND